MTRPTQTQRPTRVHQPVSASLGTFMCAAVLAAALSATQPTLASAGAGVANGVAVNDFSTDHRPTGRFFNASVGARTTL